ncbi:hypothetical protein ZWY2020_014837 [Hordeum vulgare]|nr:hypothetical protein ZWY2020_014837 [Hordeum vulgare]
MMEATTPWSIKKYLRDFFYHSASLEPQVFHVSREINGIAHNVALQFLRCDVEPHISCFASAHRNATCRVVSLLSKFHIQAFVIHVVRCY